MDYWRSSRARQSNCHTRTLKMRDKNFCFHMKIINFKSRSIVFMGVNLRLVDVFCPIFVLVESHFL